MSDPQVASFLVPEYDAAMSIRDWHVSFAMQNVPALTRLQAMTPGRVVLVTIDPADLKPKVAFRTAQNAMAILPLEEAQAVGPDKIVVISYDADGTAIVTRFRIGDLGDEEANGTQTAENEEKHDTSTP